MRGSQCVIYGRNAGNYTGKTKMTTDNYLNFESENQSDHFSYVKD